MTQQIDEKIASKVLVRLITHLQNRTDVQNIDLMNLSGFCRNCLAKWYHEELVKSGQDADIKTIKQMVYGMDYDEWKNKYQTPATPEQLAKRNPSS